MGRTKIQINKGELLKAIQELEGKQVFPNINSLAQAVSLCEWGLNNRVTPSVCVLRLKEFGLSNEIATKPGKKGRQSGQVLSEEHKQKLQAGRTKEYDAAFAKRLKKNLSSRYHGTIDKAAKGNKAAAIKCMCLSCVCEDVKEIRLCTINSCPLYNLRPYK
jgi:hypothetical protein